MQKPTIKRSENRLSLKIPGETFWNIASDKNKKGDIFSTFNIRLTQKGAKLKNKLSVIIEIMLYLQSEVFWNILAISVSSIRNRIFIIFPCLHFIYFFFVVVGFQMYLCFVL